MNNIKFYLYQIIDKKYPVVILNGLIFILAYLLLIIPLHQDLHESHLQLLRAQQAHEQQVLQINQTAQDEQQLKFLSQQWHTMLANGLSPKHIDSVFIDLESLAKNASVNLSYEMQHQMVKISLQSDYLSLLYFIDSLIKKPYFLLSDLQLKREAGFIMTSFHLHILLAEDHV